MKKGNLRWLVRGLKQPSNIKTPMGSRYWTFRIEVPDGTCRLAAKVKTYQFLARMQRFCYTPTIAHAAVQKVLGLGPRAWKVV